MSSDQKRQLEEPMELKHEQVKIRKVNAVAAVMAATLQFTQAGLEVPEILKSLLM